MHSSLVLARIFSMCFSLVAGPAASAAIYHVHPTRGDDANPGTSAATPLRTLARASQLVLKPGDQLLLARDEILSGALVLGEIAGTAAQPIIVSSYGGGVNAASAGPARATIDARGRANAVWLRNARHIHVRDLILQADGGGLGDEDQAAEMRCDLLVSTTQSGEFGGITLERLAVRDVFFEERGFQRGKEEVKTANGLALRGRTAGGEAAHDQSSRLAWPHGRHWRRRNFRRDWNVCPLALEMGGLRRTDRSGDRLPRRRRNGCLGLAPPNLERSTSVCGHRGGIREGSPMPAARLTELAAHKRLLVAEADLHRELISLAGFSLKSRVDETRGRIRANRWWWLAGAAGAGVLTARSPLARWLPAVVTAWRLMQSYRRP